MLYGVPDYSMDLTEKDYEARVKLFMLSEFDSFRQKQLRNCIDDLMSSNKGIG